jgi:hypothetical protein
LATATATATATPLAGKDQGDEGGVGGQQQRPGGAAEPAGGLGQGQEGDQGAQQGQQGQAELVGGQHLQGAASAPAPRVIVTL